MSGYIYGAERLPGGRALEDIPNAFVTPEPVRPDQCEFIPDAYEALLAAEKAGALRIVPYEQLSAQRREWIIKTIAAEYAGAEAHPEYRHFLKGKFPFLKK